jgi:hypothetical protein
MVVGETLTEVNVRLKMIITSEVHEAEVKQAGHLAFILSSSSYHMSLFAPKPGCPMCGIVASAAHTTPNSPRSPVFPLGSTQPEVVWRDENFTVYRERANPVSAKGHLIIAFKCVFLFLVLQGSDSRVACTFRPSTPSYVLSFIFRTLH